MYYLYVLKSVKYRRYYIGINGDLKKRFAKHNGKGVRSTKAYVPWNLVYSVSFPTRKEARSREIYLKRHSWERNQLYLKIAHDGMAVPSSIG